MCPMTWILFLHDSGRHVVDMNMTYCFTRIKCISFVPLFLWYTTLETLAATPLNNNETRDGRTVGDDDPICVVGGGLSGLVVSIQLQELLTKYSCYGTRVHLFEQNYDHYGGKLNTEVGHEKYNVWEKGPVIFTEEDKFLLKYLRRCDMVTGERGLVQWRGENLAAFDPEKGYSIPFLELVADQKVRKSLVLAVQMYGICRDQYPKSWFTPEGMARIHEKRGTHPELFLSAYDWLAMNGLSMLNDAMTIVFTCEGYGDIKTLPALYMLKLLTPEVATKLLGLPLSPPGDRSPDRPAVVTIKESFRELASCLSEYKRIPNKILGYKLIRLQRVRTPARNRIKLTFALGSEAQSQEIICKRVVIAFPPLLSNLGKIFQDMTYEEKSLFDAVKVHKYITSGHTIQSKHDKYVNVGILNGTKTGLGPQGNGGPIAFVRSGKSDPSSRAYTAYSWIYGKYSSGPTEGDLGQVKERLWTFLEKFNEVPPGGEVPFIQGYEYFPHVNNVSLAEGWLARFDALQGEDGIYYASPVQTFEAMNPTIEMAEYVACRVWSDLWWKDKWWACTDATPQCPVQETTNLHYMKYYK